jgi:diadenosine tetraphosphate (Ap4A) HIT family hydrolase
VTEPLTVIIPKKLVMEFEDVTEDNVSQISNPSQRPSVFDQLNKIEKQKKTTFRAPFLSGQNVKTAASIVAINVDEPIQARKTQVPVAGLKQTKI